VPDFVSAVQAGDVEKLATVPGIGQKSAGRIALELKDKVQRLGPPVSASETLRSQDDRDVVREDALSALVNLGYRAVEIKEVLKRVALTASAPLSLKELIREALKDLAKG
jgi:Holliday junction DNA helicase RuvA